MFSISGSMLEILLYVTSSQARETDVSLVLKDSDRESEYLVSLIQFSVSDRQKTDMSKGILREKSLAIIYNGVLHRRSMKH